MSDRDTLAKLILDDEEVGMTPLAIADDLIERGWRTPAREITTVAEADALPIGSMVVDVFAAGCTRIGADPVFGWVRATSALKSGRQYGSPHLPATVVYVPTEES